MTRIRVRTVLAMTTARITATLRRALETSDFAAWGECLAPDALLNATVCGRRFQGTGPEQIVANHQSMYPCPSAIFEWCEIPAAGGVVVEFEQRRGDGADRRYAVVLAIEAGRVTAEVVYSGTLARAIQRQGARRIAAARRDPFGETLPTR